ncbi:GNAT family N-acetyltransferase [Enterococcus casseliflavus]|uniref:GNAT family N-acetyltransferase n=1 Tax=Enterococcus casseliflavus TaxID=37734 RepID=UPI001884840A|nr:GNAT family N-acetyltransferase [Enterococcus casseliflavus]MBE9908866.1 GNAT family N-acetyltransferase [Enterococcus casseliflavus]
MVEFRKAKKIETMAIHQLVQRTIKATYPKYYPEEVVSFFEDLHNEKKIFKNNSARNIWVLCDGSTIIGTCTCIGNIIMRLFVSPEAQNQGYGTLMLNRIENLIFQKHDFVVLEAVVSAARMYERRGYRTINHEKLIISESAIVTYEIMRLDKTKMLSK